MLDPNDPAGHYRMASWAVGDLAEAALHSGRRDEARAALARAEASAGPIPSPRLRIALDYARPLRAAKEAFDALGSPPFSDRARRELRAAGVQSRPAGGRAAADGLTPQELQIAHMAARGLSNREIGRRLYLSHRTVGAHLYRAFPKLGITARGQLPGALGTSPP